MHRNINELESEYKDIIDFCLNSNNQRLIGLAQELTSITDFNSNKHAQHLDDILLDIADYIYGFDGSRFYKSEYWEYNNNDANNNNALDLAYHIYRNLITELPEDRELFCSYLDGILYFDLDY